jgi:hypothetical protein
MGARRPEARFAMLSTAWSRTDPFWTAWASDDESWTRLKATADNVESFDPQFLEQERRALGEDGFKREYLGNPLGAHASPFTWELYERATQVRAPPWCRLVRRFTRALKSGRCALQTRSTNRPEDSHDL